FDYHAPSIEAARKAAALSRLPATARRYPRHETDLQPSLNPIPELLTQPADDLVFCGPSVQMRLPIAVTVACRAGCVRPWPGCLFALAQADDVGPPNIFRHTYR